MKNPTESRLHMRSVLTATASALVTCFAFANPAWAQSNSIESITSAQQGSTTVLRIQLSRPPSDSTPSFSISNPPRIALDFNDTDSKLVNNLLAMDNGDVRSVNARWRRASARRR